MTSSMSSSVRPVGATSATAHATSMELTSFMTDDVSAETAKSEARVKAFGRRGLARGSFHEAFLMAPLMKIHRERWLLLAGLVGLAGACTSKATSGPSTEDAGPPPSSDAGKRDTGAVGGDLDAGFDSGPRVYGDADLLIDWDGGCLGTGGGNLSACAPYDIVEPEGGAPNEDSGGGAPCVTFDLCESISALNTGVAGQVLNCAGNDPTAPACTNTTACVLAALSVACPSSSAATTCGPIVSACADAGVTDAGAGPIDLAQCEGVVSGFNSTTLQTLISCMSTTCNLEQCVANLF
jgi:hypothetical protein